ncbi:alpha/beta hydrolase [Streptomyces sp. NPDC003036]|uniref:alpha/beta hydrolase n=1 Tax=Streptomyces sp. NPDC003036 TaxID=3154442 RepID=UPI0033B9D8FC
MPYAAHRDRDRGRDRDAQDVVWHPLRVRAARHDIPVRVYRPEGGHAGWLVWGHGGSWRTGSLEGWHAACADLAGRSGCAVVSVDYRLAPQHRHPAALHDVLTVLDWAQERAAAEGLPPVAVGGDSSGGTIAASAALVRRDRGEPLSAQVLAYPPLDPSCRARSYTRYRDNFPSQEGMAAAWRDYRGGNTGAAFPPSTPFEADSLAGLAPAILGVGAFDPVADDVRAYARMLRQAGNDVTFHEFPHLLHGAFLQPAGVGGFRFRDGRSEGADDPRGLRHWLADALSDRLSGPRAAPRL